ncbi:hypothetical protein OG455_19910 [Kitasatospora sp. NBC_01287]|nr:hypothetical protein [Kitasatospora sp. NBC_01287]
MARTSSKGSAAGAGPWSGLNHTRRGFTGLSDSPDSAMRRCSYAFQRGVISWCVS